MATGAGSALTRRAGLLAAAFAVAAATIGAGVATAAVGDISYRDCISGETASTACASTSGATATGGDSGLVGLQAAEVSPDGRSLYAVAPGDDAIVVFGRDRRSGGLSYRGCISGKTEAAAACTLAPNAASGGAGSGLDGAQYLAISEDGRSVYVTGRLDDAVTTFRRDRTTGALTHRGCITADTSGVACATIPGAAPNGTGTALASVDAIDASSDGRSVYTGTSDGTVAHLRRNRKTGQLSFRGCITADSNVNCRRIPGAVPGGSDTGFASMRYIALSPDGRSLYTASDSDEAVGHFQRRPKSGRLDFRRCVTGATVITNCVPISGATMNGDGTGLRSLVHVTVSPDGNSVYTVADSDEAIARFDRRPGSGALAFRDCFSGSSNVAGCTPVPGATATAADSGMDSSVWAEVAPDGRSVHVAGAGDDAVVTFRRVPRTGALRPRGCLTAETETTSCTQIPGAASQGQDTGLDDPRGLAASPDGRSLYAAATDDAALTRFGRQPDRRGPRLRVKARTRQGGTGVLVRARCRDELCARLIARGRARIGGRSHRLRRAAKRDVRAGKQTKLRLRLTAGAKAATGSGARVRVTVVARDLLGNRTKKRARVRLGG